MNGYNAILTLHTVKGSWKWASNTLELGKKITLEINLKKLQSRFWKATNLGLCILNILSSYFFGDQISRFDMWKRELKDLKSFL